MDGVIHIVRCFEGVGDSKVEHTINFDFYVVGSNGCLRVNIEHLFFQTVMIRNRLEDGDLEFEAGFHDS